VKNPFSIFQFHGNPSVNSGGKAKSNFPPSIFCQNNQGRRKLKHFFTFLFLIAMSPLLSFGFEAKFDLEDYAKQNFWRLFNASGDLGEVGKAAPGYKADCYLDREKMLYDTELSFLPMTMQEEDGNHFIAVPGSPILREYDVCPGLRSFYLPKEGEIEISFRLKYLPDCHGDLHPLIPVTFDFRSTNQDLLYGPVNKRYPVLKAKTFRPTCEWQTFRFRSEITEIAHPYSIKLRLTLHQQEDKMNTLCLDDFSLTYLDEKEQREDELVFNHSAPSALYLKGTPVLPEIRALLHSEHPEETVELICRKRYSHEHIRRTALVLQKQGRKTPDGRTLFCGNVDMTPNLYGGFEIIPLWKNKVLHSVGNDFQVIHPVSPEKSPLQKKLGAHFTFGSGFMLSFDQTTRPFRGTQDIYTSADQCRAAGFGHLMLCFDFRSVTPDSPEAGETKLLRPQVDLVKHMKMEPVGLLGGWVNYQNRRKHQKQFSANSMLPNWLYQEKYLSTHKNRYLPCETAWKTLMNATLNEFNDIHVWMLLCEPQWSYAALDYFNVQKLVWSMLKENNPNDILIAASATSDQGYNLTGWLAKLHELGFEDYCSYVSFNPYASGEDFKNGVRNRHTNLLDRIRKELKPGTPLWEQELYYIGHSKREQKALNQGYFAGADAQRHYLLGFRQGLGGITGIAASSLARYPYVASEVVPALNALSFFLAGKTKVIVPTIANDRVRGVIFTDDDEKTASGAVWVLQKSAKMIRQEINEIRFFDTYGNDMQFDEKVIRLYDTHGNEMYFAELALTLDPIFFTGSVSGLKAMLEKSLLDMGCPIQIFRRKFGGEGFCEAKNISGQPDVIAIIPGDKKDAIQFNLVEKDSCFFRDSSLLNDAGIFRISGQMQEQKVSEIPAVPENTLNMSENHPMLTKDGNEVFFRMEEENLIVSGFVKDAQFTEGEGLFDGDAVELFIDQTPFRSLAHNDISNSLQDVKISQFIFAASGKKKKLDLVKKSEIPTGSFCKITPTAGGWDFAMSIPLAEISPLDTEILGINLEIFRVDETEKLPKDTLFGTPGVSYKERLHYPLFRLPKSLAPDWVQPDAERASGRRSFDMEPTWGPTLRVCRFSVRARPLTPGNYHLRFLLKGAKIDHMKFQITGAKQTVVAKHFLPQPDSWKMLNFDFTVTQEEKHAGISFEFLAPRPDRDAWVEVSQVELTKE
jgi:hypothetical protein